MNLNELLSQFGLTNQEAVIYIMLNTEGALTGYEVSKLTGISRSNVYTSLANLTDKGVANLTEGENKLYSPVNIEEFCRNKIRQMQKSAEKLYQNIPKKRDEFEGYLTIRGRDNILNKMINIILNAEKRIYLSMHCEILNLLKEYLEEMIIKELKVVIITNENFTLPGAKIYYTDKKFNEVRLIADSQKVITGDVKDETSTSLYSSKRNLVELVKESLTNEIELICIRSENN